MAESRVLVVDADAERAGRTAAVLRFCDVNPVVVDDAGPLVGDPHSPRDWVAIVVGGIADAGAWRGFLEWLRRDPLHPPLLLLPEHLGFQADRWGLPEDVAWPLDEPIRNPQLSDYLKRASLTRLEVEQRASCHHGGPTGRSAQVQGLRRLIRQVAGVDTTVLVLGESGTGKEVVARALHENSSRRGKPFVAINCGAIPGDLLESELFGHEKGAFTGAITARKGRFEMAEGGTLFLDEIGDMSLPMQVKLLRVLQERTFERVGSNKSITADVRIIAATHRDLETQIEHGKFREDLFYRLNVFPIDTPPLRERAEDIPLLITELIKRIEHEKRGSVRLTPTAVMALTEYPWPGNVRELANLIERLIIMFPYRIVDLPDLPAKFRKNASSSDAAPRGEESFVPLEWVSAPRLPRGGLDLKEHMSNLEYSLIKQALDEANGVVAHAAKLLNMRRTTLVEKLRKYGHGTQERRQEFDDTPRLSS